MSQVLNISSITGVDLELEIAGPGARSYAFIIDWHIRLLVALAWLFAGSLLYVRLHGSIDSGGRAGYFYAVGLPSLLLYFLYHPVIETLMHGRTPGKRMAGVRLVMRDGALPGTGPLLVRNIFRLVDALPAFYCVGLAAAVVSKESLRIGDIAAGTVLVYDAAGTEAALQALPLHTVEKLGLEQAEVVRDLLGRWNELRPEVRSSLAQRLLAKLRNHSAAESAAGADRPRPTPRNDEALRAALEGLLD
ncbi:MAG TPA: RDD family protein [Gammaproteobacteria bacterium]|nr:RDD family protein [Gammaproteobacteria bacterium]